jgi:hypothetical protein
VVVPERVDVLEVDGVDVSDIVAVERVQRGPLMAIRRCRDTESQLISESVLGASVCSGESERAGPCAHE